MKKLITLMLLAFVGGVGTASAFNDNIYFMSNSNEWSSTNHKFTCISENEFVTDLTTSEVTYLKTNDIRFKFVVNDWSCNVGSTNTNDASVSTEKYSSSNGAGDAGCLVISKNANAVRAQIRLKYNNNTWDITACVFETNDTYSISFDKSLNSTSSSWSNVYCYTYINDHALVSWTETKMAANGNIYTCTVPSIATHVIFNNGETGSYNQSWDITDLEDNGVYKFDGLYGITATITSDYATFSCDRALDFTGTGITAYIAESTASGNVTMTPVTKVPANTGLFLAGTTANIPVIASSDAEAVATNFLHPTDGTTDINTLSADCYVLANQGGVGFFKVTSSCTPAKGKAYLQLESPVTSSRLNILFDEATGIKNIAARQTSGEAYNLQGQRIAQPAKGLYIVNGKKVIKK